MRATCEVGLYALNVCGMKHTRFAGRLLGAAITATALLQTTTLMSQHGTPSKGKILMIAANPSVSKTTGWPIGCWAAELTHPYWEFIHAGYEVEIVSPDGGKLEFDGYSDPEDASGYSADDLLSLGWKHSKKHMDLLANTRKLADVNMNDYAAILLVGGQSPMYTFRGNQALADFVVKYYQTGRPTALVCHSTCVLLDAKLPNGKYLVEGKRWTGFANSEEQFADNFVGKRIQPFWIEDEARKMPGSRFEVAPMFTPYAIQDGNLITGQQQNSGAAAADLVIKALAKN
jgi:putative intracellular protease/amidase